MIRILKTFIFLSLSMVQVLAQDPQLSQYYNAPLFLNPALTGVVNNTRGVLNYRSQWTALPTPYNSFAASFDHYIEPYSSGIGLLIKRDRQGEAGLTSTDINLIYSYHVYLQENLTFVPAIQVGYVNRDLNFSNLIFGDQLTNSGASSIPTMDKFLNNGSRVSFLDFAAGGIVYSDQFWIGYSAHHLNRPNEAFAGTSRLAMKSSIHAGYKFFIQRPGEGGMYSARSREKSIIPTFMYKMQGAFDQFDLGVYAIYEPIMLGLWYRGLPVKKYEAGINNHESLIALVGIYYQGLTLGYSYDLTISSLRPGSGGSHELSLLYEWKIPYHHYKKKKRARRVSCPGFYR